MTILDLLKGITNYPVPQRVFDAAGLAGKIALCDDADENTFTQEGYLKAKLHVLRFLVMAPSAISEQGVSFSFSEAEKASFRRECKELEKELSKGAFISFGYVGDAL